MKARLYKLTSILFFMLFSLLHFPAQAEQLCRVPTKNSRLAKDQRDDLRLKCLKKQKSRITVAPCLNIAKSMEYSTNAEEARLICLYDLRQQPTLRECFAITNAMEYPDTGDEARWECLRRFNQRMTGKQCLWLAQKMSYPANSQRANLYCTQELR